MTLILPSQHVLRAFFYTNRRKNRLQTAIDVVREQFGFLAIQKGTVLTEGSRNIERSKLIGGHSAGGLEGLK